VYAKWVLEARETQKVTLTAPGARREVTSVPRRIDVSSFAPLHIQFVVHHDGEIIAGYTTQGGFPLFWPVPMRLRMVDIDVLVTNVGEDANGVEVNDLHNVTEQVLLAQASEVEKFLEERSTLSPLHERLR
jgi:hypothetical protein